MLRGGAMGRLEIQEQYEEYIAEVSSKAMTIGRRVPHHLEYLRRHGCTRPVKLDGEARPGKEESMET